MTLVRRSVTTAAVVAAAVVVVAGGVAGAAVDVTGAAAPAAGDVSASALALLGRDHQGAPLLNTNHYSMTESTAVSVLYNPTATGTMGVSVSMARRMKPRPKSVSL